MKDVPGYEGLYKACEDGSVYSCLSKRFLKRTSPTHWYLDITLCKKGVYKPVKLHRIIAMTFIANPNNFPEVNHKNGVKTDNRVENLEWCNRSYNIKHSYQQLGRARASGVKNAKYRPVLDTVTGIFYDSTTEAAAAKNVSRDKVKNGIRAKTSEFIFC